MWATEPLDSVVGEISDEQVAFTVKTQARRLEQLTLPAAHALTHSLQKASVCRAVDLDPMARKV